MGGTIKLVGNSGTIVFNNCFSISSEANMPVLDMGSGQEVSINNYSGILKLTNKTGIETSNIYAVEGKIYIDSSCVNGTINIFGGDIEDNSGSGCTVNHIVSGFDDSSLNELLNIEKGNWKIEQNQMIFFN